MTTCKKTFRNASTRIKGLAFYFLVFAFVLRSLIPAGFMLQYNADSSRFITIEICTPEGSYSMAMALSDESSSEHQQDAASHQQACTFGSLVLQLFNAEPPSTAIVFSPHVRLALASEHNVNLPYFTVFGAPLGSRTTPQSAI